MKLEDKSLNFDLKTNHKKQVRVGKVKIDFSHYKGNDLYSDGEIEDTILAACISGKESELLKNSSRWPILYHLSDVRHNILLTHFFSGKENALEIGSGCGGITSALARNVSELTCVELSKKRSLINAYRNKDKSNITIRVGNFQDIEPDLGKYDLITMIGVWEYSSGYIENSEDPYLEMLLMIKKHLTDNGVLLIAIENKMGMKYFNGAWEDHTGKQYSGLNDYVGCNGIRTFSVKEIRRYLRDAGFEHFSFRYPVPDYKMPECIYSDDFLPRAGEIRTYRKDYSAPRIYNYFDATAYDQICSDDMFGYFSNSFLISIGKNEENIYSKCTIDRRKKYSVVTSIKKISDGRIVVKSPYYSEGVEHVLNMKTNELWFRESYNNIRCLRGWIDDNTYCTPYIAGRTIESDMYTYRYNVSCFVERTRFYVEKIFEIDSEEKFDEFTVTPQFKEYFGEIKIEKTYTKKNTNIDLTFANLLVDDKGYIYAIDFEWVFDFPIPFKYPLWRALCHLYNTYKIYLKDKMRFMDFLSEFSIDETDHKIFETMESNFGNVIFSKRRNRENYIENYIQRSILQSSILK